MFFFFFTLLYANKRVHNYNVTLWDCTSLISKS